MNLVKKHNERIKELELSIKLGELTKDDVSLIIENVLDVLIEVGNGTTEDELHKAADYLLALRDKWFIKHLKDDKSINDNMNHEQQCDIDVSNRLVTDVLPKNNCSNCSAFMIENLEKFKSNEFGYYAIECKNFVHPLQDCVLRGFKGHSLKHLEDDKSINDDGKEEENVINIPLDCFWLSGKWKQPPVKIKHGDLVDVTHEDYPMGTMLGRYIGDGYGVVELYNYATGITYVRGKVTGRGYNRNPRLISDEKLFEFISENE